MSTIDPRTAETIDLDICPDCMFLLANGEIDNGDDGHTARVDAALAANWAPGTITLGRIGATDDDEEYAEFSSAPCDGCGTRLAGSRHPATGWMPRKD